MTLPARLLALTALLAALMQAWLWWSGGGPAAARWLPMVGAVGALVWAAVSRTPRGAAAGLAATLCACVAFWLGALELALYFRVLFARGLLVLLTLASLHATVIFTGLTSPEVSSATGPVAWRAAAGRRALVFLSIVLATLATLETAARALSPLRSYELIPDEPAAGPCLVRSADGRLNGVPGCSGRYIHRDFDGVRVEFNALGLRDGLDEITPPADHERSVLVLGDSFAYGMGVELEDSFQQLLGARLRGGGLPVRVYGAAMPGAGTAHERWVLEELGPRLSPRVVVLALFEDNDLQENWQALHQPERIDESSLPGPPTAWRFLTSTAGWPFWRTTSSLLQLRRVDGRPTAVLEAAMREQAPTTIEPMRSAVLDQLDAIEAATRSLGAELVVLLVPAMVQAEPESFAAFAERHPDHAYSRTAFHRALAEDLAARGLSVVDPLPRLEAATAAGQACYHREGHWNARGHALAAGLLDAALTPLLRPYDGAAAPAGAAATPTKGDSGG